MKTKTFAVFILVAGLVILTGCQKTADTTTPNKQPALKVGKPTVVTKGKTPVEHVQEYFTAYQEKNWDKAYELQPAVNKAKQSKEQFIQLRQSFPISEFKVLPVRDQGDVQLIDVEYKLDKFGTWVSSWKFQKKGNDWIAELFQARQTGQ